MRMEANFLPQIMKDDGFRASRHEDEGIEGELIAWSDQSGVQGLLEKYKPTGPLVIPALQS